LENSRQGGSMDARRRRAGGRMMRRVTGVSVQTRVLERKDIEAANMKGEMFCFADSILHPVVMTATGSSSSSLPTKSHPVLCVKRTKMPLVKIGRIVGQAPQKWSPRPPSNRTQYRRRTDQLPGSWCELGSRPRCSTFGGPWLAGPAMLWIFPPTAHPPEFWVWLRGLARCCSLAAR
jgi:hypothetical protein